MPLSSFLDAGTLFVSYIQKVTHFFKKKIKSKAKQSPLLVLFKIFSDSFYLVID